MPADQTASHHPQSHRSPIAVVDKMLDVGVAGVAAQPDGEGSVDAVDSVVTAISALSYYFQISCFGRHVRLKYVGVVFFLPLLLRVAGLESMGRAERRRWRATGEGVLSGCYSAGKRMCGSWGVV